MAKVLFLFMDGVGLGESDPSLNPFVAADMPTLEGLLGGAKMVASTAPFHGEFASMVSVDAQMGVPGTPQSATGQASIVTGVNVSAAVGEHYGPKPNKAVSVVVEKSNVFTTIVERGGTANLLNAYPPRYFRSIESGHRLYSVIPLAATSAGIELMTAEDMQAGKAFSVDFTGVGWSEQPGFPPAPVYSPAEAGALLSELSSQVDLCWFDYWLSDILGHRGTMPQAVEMLHNFDEVLSGLVDAWQERDDLIIISSDHGNLENLEKRGHTLNPVPALCIGPQHLRDQILPNLTDLTSFASAIIDLIFEHN
jgi:hypothetical protein